MRSCRMLICLLACVVILSACSCKHQWQSADGGTTKTCSLCGETSGEPAGSVPEETDPLSSTETSTQNSASVDAVTDTTPPESLVAEKLFLCSPTEFMERMVRIAGENGCEFTYKMGSNQGLLQADLTYGAYQALIQFFRADTTTMADDQSESREMWCVSLIHIGNCPAEVCDYFWMAADPQLDKTGTLNLQTRLVVELANAAARGESMGYVTENGLLHEMGIIPAGAMGLQENMYMYNVYASDFR